MPIKIMIADDQRLFRQTLRYMLDREPELTVVGEGQDGHDAVLICKNTMPNIALMDLVMPRMDGIAATRLLRTVCPATKVLMLSVHADDQQIKLALEAGAVGYILKDASCEEFLQIIKSTHAGEECLSPYLAKAKTLEVKRIDDIYHLTEREGEILELLVRGFSNSAIAKTLFVSDETVKMYLKHIYRKINAKNRTEAAVIAIKYELLKKPQEG